ncbi:MAG: hypothetical protein JWR18_1496 [Segetibacter sp.]|nr:hypothetical protein [Segetibacter sp.]
MFLIHRLIANTHFTIFKIKIVSNLLLHKPSDWLFKHIKHQKHLLRTDKKSKNFLLNLKHSFYRVNIVSYSCVKNKFYSSFNPVSIFRPLVIRILQILLKKDD